MGVDTPDDVGEVGLGINAIQPAGLDDRVEDSSAITAGVRAQERPVAPPQGQGSDGALCSIIGHFQTPVAGEQGQGASTMRLVSGENCTVPNPEV